MVDDGVILGVLSIIVTVGGIILGIHYAKKYGKIQTGSSFKKSFPTLDKKLKKYFLHLTVGRESLNDSNLRDGEIFNVNIWTIKINNKSLKSKILRTLRMLYNCKVSIHIENFTSVFNLYFKPSDANLPTRYICNAGLNHISSEQLRTEYEKRIGFDYIINLLQITKEQTIIEKGKDAELLFLLTIESSNNAFIINKGQIGWMSETLAFKQEEQFLFLPIGNERIVNLFIDYSYKEKGRDIYRQIEKAYKLKINSWNEIKLE